ncbi:hypothetical protein CRG98_035212 [Punica granatum]|uniref:Protein kinase domain-containing protein n=1 Tax=Punica granatum TaxID=22663 RepID=A0A2I0IK65_PUNGR|nr:hypothetical protein CRG98_035212 [Punica granatum]
MWYREACPLPSHLGRISRREVCIVVCPSLIMKSFEMPRTILTNKKNSVTEALALFFTTNNILLDENFSVKVADFGLSRLFPFNVTHVSTAPQGTPGYVDPEYHQCYQLTEKSDVYSFGVVLMELISSLPAVDIMRHRHEINLSTMAVNKIHTGALHELVDPNLGFESNCDMRKMITAVAELGFQCLQNAKEMRPSMAEVLRTLTDIQKQDSDGEKKAEENDDAVLLKANPMVLSPDSVAVKWMHSPQHLPQ